MSKFMIEKTDFQQLESEKIWSFPSTYSEDRKRNETKEMVFSGDYLGALKKDGYYYRFVKGPEGDMVLQGRNRGKGGDFLNKIGHLPHLADFFDSLPNGTCLLGEIYFPSKAGSKNVTTIMGCKEETALSRQKKADELLNFFVFDVWAYAGVSQLSTTAERRFELLDNLAPMFQNQYVQFAKYYKGERLWNLYQTALAEGEEGVVMTKSDSIPGPGKRTAKKTLKLKKELQETLDVFVIGANPPTRLYTGKTLETWPYWQEVRTGRMVSDEKERQYRKGEGYEPVTKNYFHGWAGSLKIGVMKDGEVLQVGSISGLEDQVLANWQDYLGKVMEITGMEIFAETGAIRHPKMVQWREDLVPEDCTYMKLIGGLE